MSGSWLLFLEDEEIKLFVLLWKQIGGLSAYSSNEGNDDTG